VEEYINRSAQPSFNGRKRYSFTQNRLDQKWVKVTQNWLGQKWVKRRAGEDAWRVWDWEGIAMAGYF
jgi:hypothetical protein